MIRVAALAPCRHFRGGTIQEMATKIGRFEIVSQLSQSSFSTVYKALDSESQQTVALKVVDLSKVRDRAALMKQVFDEADIARPLNSHNIAALYGVGDEEDRLLAAVEYVQGNSIATTMARKDGFSIWDFQDISRQVCHALDHAHVHGVVHNSLEPAKIMVQWDGLVKVLGFGISTMNSTATASAAAPEILYYASPEQIRGEACDHRSVMFSLGCVLYEMATEQKAFAGETTEQVKAAILESTPPLPLRLKANLNPALSELIMKAIAKTPADRYQSGQELVRDLENCKSGGVKTSASAPPVQKMKAQAAASGAISAPAAPAPAAPRPKITAAAAPIAPASSKPNFAVDPMMAEEPEGASPAASFSEISELPPLKEVYTDPEPPAAPETAAAEALPQVVLRNRAAEPAKIQVREAAEKAVTEIRKTPPRLFFYAAVVALVLIGVIVAGITLHNYLEERIVNDGGSSAPAPAMNPAPVAAKPAAPAPVPAAEPAAQQQQPTEAASTEKASPGAGKRARLRKSQPAEPAILPAQLTINSNPPGAQIGFDGSSLCVTPCTLTGIVPGQHNLSATKTGFSAENRAITMTSGENGSVSIELSQLPARVSVASTPAGAAIVVDGKDSGKLTPSVLVVGRPGTHTIVIRRYGYLEETASVNSELGQTANISLTLKPLGNTDQIRPAGGKFLKVFGKGNSGAAEMGIVSIKTQPKGAQIMVNNAVLDKTAPFDFYLNPGTYVIDLSMSGYKGVHRVINVVQQERVTIEAILTPE
jgi:hypothetical protein